MKASERARARARLALGRGQPPERALLALGERDPVLDAGVLHGVQQVLRLKGEVALKHKDKLAAREECDLADMR